MDGRVDRRKGTHVNDNNERTRKKIYAHLPTLPNARPRLLSKEQTTNTKKESADTVSSTELDSKCTMKLCTAEAEAKSDDSRGSRTEARFEMEARRGEGGARIVCMVRGDVCM